MTLMPSLQEAVDSLRATGQSTAYDSVWASEIPTNAASGLESVMLSHDKIYVVLMVVLIIWIGLTIFLFRTDRRLDKLERLVDERIGDQESL